jgi:hypothetical protein
MEIDLRSKTQLFLGLFERETHSWLRRFSPGTATAIDIGANEGEYSIYFLLHTPARSVLGFEPDTAVWPLLRSNLALNHLRDDQRLTLSSKFVGDREDGGMCTLDSITASTQAPYLIKLDVDGAETSVLRGARRLLASGVPSRWIIETHSRDLERECIEIMRAAGYTTTIISNAWWRTILPELRPLEHNRWLVATNEPNRF